MSRTRATGAQCAQGVCGGVPRMRVYAEPNDRKLPASHHYRGPHPAGVFFTTPLCRPLAADGAATARPHWAMVASAPIPPGMA